MQNLKRNFILTGLIVLFSLIPIKDTIAQWTEICNPVGETVYCLYSYNNELFAGVGSGLSSGTNRIYKYDDSFWIITLTDANIYKIRSFEEYNNELYAGGGSGEIFKYNSAASPPWETFHDFGAGDDINSLVVYNNELHAAVSPCSGVPAEIYKYDGTNWSGTNFGIVGEPKVYSLIVYNNELYAGTGDVATRGKIFKYNNIAGNWNLIDTITEERVNSLIVYNNGLYAASGYDGKIFKYNGTNFNMVYDTLERMIESGALIEYNNDLYAAANTKLFIYNGTSWSEEENNIANTGNLSTLGIFNNKLYAGARTYEGAFPNAKIFVYEGGSGPAPPPPPPTFFEGLVPCGRHYDNPDTDNVNESDECTVCHFFYLIKNLIDFVAGIAVVVAILFIAFGGVMYIGSTGNEAMLSKAKGIILWAIVGFVLIFAAYIIIGLILSTFGYTNPLGGEWDVIC